MPPSTSQEALKQLYGLQRSRKKPTDILNESEGRLGLPTARERQAGLRGAIMNTENMIRNVEPSVTGRTSGSLTTEAQRQAIVGQETRPLAEQFREQSRALEGETANLDALSSRALAETQLGIGEQDAKERFLGSIYDKLLGTEAENQRRSEAQRAYDLQVRQLEEQIRQQKAASSQYSGLQAALQGLLNTPAAATSTKPPLDSIFDNSTPGLIVKPSNSQTNLLQAANRVQPQVTVRGTQLQGGSTNAAPGSAVPRVKRPWEY